MSEANGAHPKAPEETTRRHVFVLLSRFVGKPLPKGFFDHFLAFCHTWKKPMVSGCFSIYLLVEAVAKGFLQKQTCEELETQ